MVSMKAEDSLRPRPFQRVLLISTETTNHDRRPGGKYHSCFRKQWNVNVILTNLLHWKRCNVSKWRQNDDISISLYNPSWHPHVGFLFKSQLFSAKLHVFWSHLGQSREGTTQSFTVSPTCSSPIGPTLLLRRAVQRRIPSLLYTRRPAEAGGAGDVTDCKDFTVTSFKHNGVSNHQERDCLFKSLSRISMKKTQNLYITGVFDVRSIHRWSVGSPQRAIIKHFRVIASSWNKAASTQRGYCVNILSI